MHVVMHTRGIGKCVKVHARGSALSISAASRIDVIGELTSPNTRRLPTVTRNDLHSPSIRPDDNLGLNRRHVFDKLHTHAIVGWLVAEHRLLKMHHAFWKRFEKRFSDFMPPQQPRRFAPPVELGGRVTTCGFGLTTGSVQNEGWSCVPSHPGDLGAPRGAFRKVHRRWRCG